MARSEFTITRTSSSLSTIRRRPSSRWEAVTDPHLTTNLQERLAESGGGCPQRTSSTMDHRAPLKVSIAVPSFNYARFLHACLESIQQQTHRDFEVLIADGGSADGSRAIIEEYVASDSRFRLVSATDHGQSHALNKALAAASGDIHCYLNADDEYLCVDALESVIGAFDRYPSMDLVSFTGWYVDERSRPVRPARLRYHPRDSAAWMRRRTAVLQPATFWRTEITARSPFREELHCAFDAWFFYQEWRECSWIELDKPVAGARIHPLNKSAHVRSSRIVELAALEAFKYGSGSWRAGYVSAIGLLIAAFEHVPVIGASLRRLTYWVVNSLAFMTFYALPGI